MDWLLEWLGRRLAKYLSQVRPEGTHLATSPPEKLAGALEPGDVLLIEGNTRISVAIKYLTQSTWSHSALYIGDALAHAPDAPAGEAALVLIEADMRAGVRAVPLSHFDGLHTRICRPAGLAGDDLKKVIDFAVTRLGESYDMKNVFDLARYLFPTPPVPTRAICSTLIAEAFGSVRYPILPEYMPPKAGAQADAAQEEMLRIRHHSLYVPRDFDISPYFSIVKPTLAHGFDYRKLRWADVQA